MTGPRLTGPVVRAAPAKINLALHVTGRRADGYHLLDTLVAFAAFGDRVNAEAAGSDAFLVAGPHAAAVPTDGVNLVLRARDLLRQRFPEARAPVRIRLEKNLPVASGVGGGSSDAAAALKALARLWNLPEETGTLAQLALPLGADVPMCLHARPLVARGIGEEIAPVDAMPALALVLAHPGAAVSTPDIFRRLERRDNPPLPPLPGARDAKNLVEWLRGCRNDLEAPALAAQPVIGAVLRALRASGAGLARMSGSGATCFGIFSSLEEAGAAAAAIRAAQPGWFVTATRSGGGDAGH